MLDSYLQRMGFEPKTGLPTRKGLEKVGLADVSQDLEECRLLVPTSPVSPSKYLISTSNYQ